MSRYIDQLTDGAGRALAGVSVYVYTYEGAVAILEDEDEEAISNPLITDTFGNYEFYAEDGLYTLKYQRGGQTILERQAVIVGEPGDLYQGDEGLSAYQVAVANGFGGTEAAWLSSLIGGSITGMATVADRTALTALSGSEAAAYLREAGRDGLFKFDGSNLSAKVSVDPGQGKYVAPASAPTGASGAWVRTDPSVKGSDTSYNGAVGGGDHALSLSKVGVIVKPDVAKAYMANMAEGPMVFWDDADGYFHMVFAAYSTGTVVASVGHAKSLDLVTWTTDATALFGASGTVGAPDRYGTTGPYIVKKNGTYNLFYIGLTATGYEGGEKSICLATATSLAGPWTRLGAVISKGAVGGTTGWRSVAIWHPSIVQRGGTHYMFFNATGTGSKERIGYATSNDLLTWTVQDSTSPLIDVGAGGSWNSEISGDPSVYRDGDYWFMNFFGSNGASASDGIAWTTDANFPLGWTQHPGNPLLVPDAAGGIDATYAHKPFVYFKGGVKYHFYTAVGIYGRCVALAVARPPSQPTIKISNMSHGNHDLIEMASNWYPGDEKGTIFRNQDGQVIGRIKLGFDTVTYLSIGHFYSGGYTTTPILRVDPTGLNVANGSYQVAGLKVIGARGAAVANAVPAAGVPTQAEFNAFVTQFNTLLARFRVATGHGAIGD